MNETPLPLWLDLDDALAYSGLKRRTLQRLVNERRVKTMKSGERRYYSRRSLEELGDGFSTAPTFPSIPPLRNQR